MVLRTSTSPTKWETYIHFNNRQDFVNMKEEVRDIKAGVDIYNVSDCILWMAWCIFGIGLEHDIDGD